MINTLVDISGKINPSWLETILDLDVITKEAGISYLIVGAAARDFDKLLSLLRNIKVGLNESNILMK